MWGHFAGNLKKELHFRVRVTIKVAIRVRG